MRIIIEIDEGKVTATTVQPEELAEEGDVLEAVTHDAGAAPAEEVGDETAALAEQGDVFGDVVPEYTALTTEGEDAGVAPASPIS